MAPKINLLTIFLENTEFHYFLIINLLNHLTNMKVSQNINFEPKNKNKFFEIEIFILSSFVIEIKNTLFISA